MTEDKKEFYDRFSNYLKKRGISKKAFTKEMGLNYIYFTQRIKYKDMPNSLRQTVTLKIDLDECRGIKKTKKP
jgi:hypothetical protein